ncbi:unnamed protein product, partial [Prorocentrum cordatum]
VGEADLGNTGLVVYVGGLSAPSPASAVAARGQPGRGARWICFPCHGCSTDALAFVAENCDTVDSACLLWQGVGSLTVENYTAHLGNATATGGLAAQCARAIDAAAGVRTRTVALAPGGHGDWCAAFDGSPLQTGQNYRICTDLDGQADALRSGVAGEVYVAPPGMLSGGVVPPSISAGAGMRSVEVACSHAHCTQLSSVFLEPRACSEGPTVPGVVAQPLAPVAGTGWRRWAALVNASALSPGAHYKLCLDVDGKEPAFPPGDTGLRVYAAPLLGAGPLVLQPKAAQLLRLPCPACSAATTAPGSNGSSVAPLALVDAAGALTTLRVEAQSLQVGASYRLCLDVDGAYGAFEYGDAGEVYVSPVTSLATRAIQASPGQQVSFQCPQCRVTSVAFLAASCAAAAAASTPERTAPV